MVNSTFPRPIGIDSSLCLLSQHTWRRILPRPIGIDSPLCLLSQHTWRRILPRRCHLDRRRGGCCPATATGANPHHVRRRPERLNCFRPSTFSARPVLYPPRACSRRTECVLGMELSSVAAFFFSRFEIFYHLWSLFVIFGDYLSSWSHPNKSQIRIPINRSGCTLSS